MVSETESLLGDFQRHTLCFDEHAAGSDGSYESLGITFTFTHTYLSRFLCVRFVRENANPNLTFTFHVTHYSLTGSLDLLTCEPCRLEGLDAERAEGKLGAAVGITLHTAFLLPSELGFLWL